MCNHYRNLVWLMCRMRTDETDTVIDKSERGTLNVNRILIFKVKMPFHCRWLRVLHWKMAHLARSPLTVSLQWKWKWIWYEQPKKWATSDKISLSNRHPKPEGKKPWLISEHSLVLFSQCRQLSSMKISCQKMMLQQNNRSNFRLYVYLLG